MSGPSRYFYLGFTKKNRNHLPLVINDNGLCLEPFREHRYVFYAARIWPNLTSRLLVFVYLVKEETILLQEFSGCRIPNDSSAVIATSSPASCTKCPACGSSIDSGHPRINVGGSSITGLPSPVSRRPVAINDSPCQFYDKNSRALLYCSMPAISGSIGTISETVVRRPDTARRGTVRRRQPYLSEQPASDRSLCGLASV